MYKILLLTSFGILACLVSNAQIGIGTSNPNSSSILDVESSEKGVLIPRMDNTAMNDIVSPADGLLIYNTEENCLFLYKESGWSSLCSGTGSSGSSSSALSQTYFKSENPHVTGRFGHSTAISDDGSVLIITSDREIDNLSAMYIFVKENGTWVRQQVIVGGVLPFFNVSISDDGNTIAVGQVISSNMFEVKIFEKMGAIWSESQTLNPSNFITASSTYFEFDVEISGNGNILVVGAPGESTGGAQSGAVFIYEKDNMGVWTQRNMIKQSTPVTSNNFGITVGVSDDGNRVVAASHTSSVGVANVVTAYGYQSLNWVEEHVFTGTGLLSTINYYGESLALSGDGETLAIQQDNELDDGVTDGWVDVFKFNSGAWGPKTELKPTEIVATEYDYFGVGMDITDGGTKLVIGALEEAGGNGLTYVSGGLTFVFTHDGSLWSQDTILRAQNKRELNEFGSKISINGNNGSIISISDIDEDGLYNNAGAVYIFE